YANEGMIITTTAKLYEEAEASLEIIKVTHFDTPLGKVLICKVKENGNVQIAGPTNTSDIKEICCDMLGFGIDTVIIDGSIDRKASASPLISDAAILATGAVLSRDINKVVEETAHVVDLYNLQQLEDDFLKNTILYEENVNRLLVVDYEFNIFQIELETGISNSDFINEKIDENIRYVYIPGALTFSTLMNIDIKKFKNVTFIIKDGTKVFINPGKWQTLKRQGFNVRVLNKINLIGITLNAYSPKGYFFNPGVLMEKMKKSIKDIDIVDIYFGGEV
ncbi:MAG: hypothetical protein MJA31_13810, partial [Clostridia bacterium]|nr:hypothetical protein [Clostridia bacterium]